MRRAQELTSQNAVELEFLIDISLPCRDIGRPVHLGGRHDLELRYGVSRRRLRVAEKRAEEFQFLRTLSWRLRM